MSAPLPGVSILISGSEILDGRVLDTNSNHIASTLTRFGIPLHEVVVLGDVRESLRDAMVRLSAHSTHIVVSGGLGPTDDDLTREVVAEALGRKVEEFPEARSHVVRYFEARNRTPDPSNFKQALLPSGSAMIPNPVGTAPGFRSVFPSGSKLYALPGVPRELKVMFDESVLPEVRADFPEAKEVRRAELRVFGRAEADVGSLVRSCRLPDAIDVSYRASFPEIHLVLKTTDTSVDLAEASARVRESLGEEYVVNEHLSESFQACVVRLLDAGNFSLALYEGMTAGAIGARLTEVPGASRVLAGVYSAYGSIGRAPGLVLPADIESCGLVSEEAASELARSTRALFRASFGLSVVGYAGPDGATPEAPAGTFLVGFASERETLALRYSFSGDRDFIRRFAVHISLDVVRRYLLGLPAPSRNLVSRRDAA